MTVLPTDGRMSSLAPYTAALPSSALVEVVTPGNAATGVNYKMQIGDLANSLSTAAQAPGGTVLGNASSTTAAMAPTAVPVLGIPASVTGSLGLANGGAAGATITIVNFGATAAYNLALPATAGTTGQVLLSQGGGTTPNLWQNLGSIAAATTGLFITGSTSIAVGIATNAVGNPQLRQGSPLSVVGVAGNATTNLADIIASGANQFLQSNAGGTGILFTTLTIATSVLPGPYQTGTLTANAVLLGNGTSPIKSVVTTAIGLPLISNGTSVAPNFAVLTLTGGGFGTTTLTVNGIVFGAGTSVPGITGAGATSLPLVAQGALNAPTFTTLPVAGGGTNTTSLTAHGVLLGNATTVAVTAAQSAGQLLIGQNATTDPSWQTVAGDMTVSAAGTATIAANAITFGKIQQVLASTFLGNNTAATANITSLAIATAQAMLAMPFGARTAKVANYTAVVGDDGSTIALGGSAYFTLTFPTASSLNATHKNVVVNEDAGRAKLITITGGSNFTLWPGQTAIVYNDNNTWRVHGNDRWKLTSAVSFYVDTVSGKNDLTTDGLVSTSAFLTYPFAYTTHLQQLDLAGQTLTVNAVQTTQNFTTGMTFNGIVPGVIDHQSYVFSGTNAGGPPGCTLLSTTAAINLFQSQGGAVFSVKDFTLKSAGTGSGVVLVAKGTIGVNNIWFDGGNGNSHMDAAGGQSLIIGWGGGYTVLGTGKVNINAVSEDHALIAMPVAVLISGSPTFTTAFVQADLGGMIDYTGATITKGAEAGPRYSATSNGIVFGGGSPTSTTFFPGSSAGTTSTGGIYV